MSPSQTRTETQTSEWRSRRQMRYGSMRTPGSSRPAFIPCFCCRLPDDDAERNWDNFPDGHALVVPEPVDVPVRIDVWHCELLWHALAVTIHNSDIDAQPHAHDLATRHVRVTVANGNAGALADGVADADAVWDALAHAGADRHAVDDDHAVYARDSDSFEFDHGDAVHDDDQHEDAEHVKVADANAVEFPDRDAFSDCDAVRVVDALANWLTLAVAVQDGGRHPEPLAHALTHRDAEYVDIGLRDANAEPGEDGLRHEHRIYERYKEQHGEPGLDALADSHEHAERCRDRKLVRHGHWDALDVTLPGRVGHAGALRDAEHVKVADAVAVAVAD